MSRIHGRNTAPELLVRSTLHKLGFRFRLHRNDLPGKPDLVFPGKKRVIFVHGCFWHGHNCTRGRLPTSNVAFWELKIGRNKERDGRVHQQLEAEGWKVLTVWQCETKDVVGLGERLVRFLTASN
jgi:DNA mismatch endonuclease (patch repair protein)